MQPSDSPLIQLITEVNTTKKHVQIPIQQLADLVKGEPRVYGRVFGLNEDPEGDTVHFLAFEKTAGGWIIKGKTKVLEFINVKIPAGGVAQETKILDSNSGHSVAYQLMVANGEQFTIKGYMLEPAYKANVMPLLILQVRQADKEGKMFLYLRGE